MNLWTNYRLRPEGYFKLRAEQGQRCASCGIHESEIVDMSRQRRGGPRPVDIRLVVDHCHASGRVRSLLCPPCNVGIGVFFEDPDRMERAAAYIRSACQASAEEFQPAMFAL
jgi:hypothetical protein